MEAWREQSLRVTVVLLMASALLIIPSLVLSEVSLLFLGGLLVLGVVFGLLRPLLSDLPAVLEHDLGTYGQDLWQAPLLAILFVLAVEPSASASELQAIGGITGLLGMVNYFLRPIYLWLFAYVHRHISEQAANEASS